MFHRLLQRNRFYRYILLSTHSSISIYDVCISAASQQTQPQRNTPKKRFSFFAFLITSCECVVFVFSVFSFILLRSFCCCFVWLLCASHQCVCVCAVERQTHMIACVCVSRESFVCSMRATHFISIRSVCATGSFLVCCVLLSFCRSHAFYNKRNIIDFCVKYVVFCCPVLVYIIKFVEISHWCVY